MTGNIYEDINKRTSGDIYIGIVGPCRTGKSTFITKFMNSLVLPHIQNGFEKKRITDELPQSSSGKTIMTTQPKFVPNEAVNIAIKDNVSFNVRLIDCVGYMVEGAMGNIEDDKMRMVSTPWNNEPIPFDMAADIGTKKVIEDHSTVGIVVTTDGSICDIDRNAYKVAEDRAITELIELGKPFTIILNSKNPESEKAKEIKKEIELKYNIPVNLINILNMSEQDIKEIFENLLFTFPIKSVSLSLPTWINALPKDHHIMSDIIEKLQSTLDNVSLVKDHTYFIDALMDNEDIKNANVEKINLGTGNIDYRVEVDKGLFYKCIEEECGYKIESDYHLMSIIKTLVSSHTKYKQIESALESSYNTGYGVISPTLNDINLESPKMIKQGSKYAVKLFAQSPTIHLIKTDVETEVCPIVGSEKQSSDVLDFLNAQFEENKDNIWQANIFGKTLSEVVGESLNSKRIEQNNIDKIAKTMQKLQSQNKSHLICFTV